MSQKYVYLFPFEKVPFGSRIFIYGAGDVGQEYLEQLLMTRYCEVLGFLDRAYDKYPELAIPIYSPDYVKNKSFDYVVVALKMGGYLRQITHTLEELGIQEDRIIYQEPREPVEVLGASTVNHVGKAQPLAYEKGGVSISLKYGPGLGDAIVKKAIFEELVRLAGDCRIDIYIPKDSELIHAVYGETKGLNLVIEDGGALYLHHRNRYHVAIKLSFLMELDHLDFASLHAIHPDFANQMQRVKNSLDEYHLSNLFVTNRYVHFQRMKYLGYDYYTYPNYFGGVFQISGHHVEIPLDPSYRSRYEQLGLSDYYVVINYGSGAGDTQKNNQVAKQWPYECWEELVRCIKRKYQKIEIVQLGTKDALPIPGADRYLLGKSLELVKYVLKDSMLLVNSEGGLVHLAAQLGTRCIVLWGPTPEEFFGYPQNINVKAGTCHGCYCLYNGFNVCARGLEKPECMWSITPEMVMERIERENIVPVIPEKCVI